MSFEPRDYLRHMLVEADYLIMQVLSAGTRSVGEETHAGDTRLQAATAASRSPFGLVDGFDGQTNTLLVSKG